jgi:hypothetical protein
MSFLMKLLEQLNPVGVAIIVLTFVVFVISFIINLVIRSRYIAIQRDLDDRHSRRTGLFRNDLLNKIVEEYKNTAMGNYSDVNTQAIIEKCFNQKLGGLLLGERFVKHTVSILITLGLLGTFLGLTLSVSQLVKLLDYTKGLIDNFASLIDGLLYAVSGMAVAFITSLVGIGCSILLTIIFIIVNAEEARETLMVNIEEYLDNTVSVVIAKDKETEYTMLNRILRQTFLEFGERIEKTLKETVEAYGEKLTHVVLDVELSSKTLESTVDKFDRSLKTFAENIRDFSEFNINLRNNIERMDVNFIKVTEALKEASKVVVENYTAIEDFSKDIRTSTEEMAQFNRQVVNEVSELVNGVKESVASIKDLGMVLQQNMNAHTQDINNYREKFNLLMNKLADEIEHLGTTAADTFSKGIDKSGEMIFNKVVSGVEDVLKEVLTMISAFKENERALAKTIAMLPDQFLTYEEAAVSRINRRFDELKQAIGK